MREFYWPWKVVSHTGFLSLFCSSLTESLCSGIDCPRRSTSTGNFSTGFDPNSIVCLPGKPVVELWWWLQSLFNMMFLTSRWYRLQAEVEQEARFAFWISGAISKGNFSAKRLTSRFWMFTGLIVGEGGIVLPPKETPVHLRLKFHRTVSNKCRLICSRYYRSRTSTSFPVPQQFQCQQESKSLHHHFLRNSADRLQILVWKHMLMAYLTMYFGLNKTRWVAAIFLLAGLEFTRSGVLGQRIQMLQQTLWCQQVQFFHTSTSSDVAGHIRHSSIGTALWPLFCLDVVSTWMLCPRRQCFFSWATRHCGMVLDRICVGERCTTAFHTV